MPDLGPCGKAFRVLLQIRTGSHWLAVATGRWRRTPFAQRLCRKCTACQVEDVAHVAFECPVYACVREAYVGLFDVVGGIDRGKSVRCQLLGQLLYRFMSQDAQPRLAWFWLRCFEQWQAAPDEPGTYFVSAGFDTLSSSDDGSESIDDWFTWCTS